MSRDYPTLGETEAYDLGFEDGKDYWQPMRDEEIIALLEANIGDDGASPGISVAIAIIKGENK